MHGLINVSVDDMDWALLHCEIYTCLRRIQHQQQAPADDTHVYRQPVLAVGAECGCTPT